MKETKNKFIKVRVTEKEQEQITEYAAAHNITISEMIRAALARMIGGKTE